MKDQSGALRDLVPFTRGRRRVLATSLLATLVVATELARPFPLKLVIDALAGAASGDDSLHLLTLMGIGALVVAITTVEAAGTYVAEFGMRRTAEAIVHDLRVATYSHLHRLTLRFHDRRPPGDLVTRLTGDVNAVGELFGESVPKVASSVLLLAGMLAVGVTIDPVLAFAVAAVAPVLAMVTIRARRTLKRSARLQRAAEGRIAALSEEALSSVRTVKALGSERYEEDRLTHTSTERRSAGEETARAEGRFGGAIDVIGSTATAAVLVIGALRVSSGAVSPGDLVVLYSYSRRVYRPLRDLARQAGRVSRAMARAERISEVLAADAVLPEDEGGHAGDRARGDLAVRDVSFGYGDRGGALHDVSLEVPAGTRLAVVGTSGAGKSTLASLVARFHDPTSGAVLLDGRDLRSCSLPWLRRQIGFVLQDTALFTGSVTENIAYGTTADRDAIERAARVAGAHGFICELPSGYDTALGSKGVGLSGGQRQRLAIARAVLRDPPVLVLDEPTSGLDAESEATVMAGIDALMAGRTTILITHSMARARHCDHIVVLDGGRVVEAGPPAALLEGSGPFRRMAVAQGLTGPAPIPAPSDPELPQIVRLFEPDAVAEVLDAQSGSPGVVLGASIRYVRYKPGTNVVVDYDVDTVSGHRRAVLMAASGRDLSARAARPESCTVAEQARRRLPDVAPVTYDSGLGALVQWLPADVWLPALSECPRDLASRIGIEVADDADVSLLAYKPRRRAVLGVDGHVLKLYADETEFRRAASALLAGRHLPVPTAIPTGFHLATRTTTQRRAQGRPPNDAAEAAEAAGSLLAGLHQATAPRARHHLDPLGGAVATSRLLTVLQPALQDRLTRLVDRLGSTAPTPNTVLCHGDYHAGQLLESGAELTVIDLDQLAFGSPAIDLATYAAHVLDGTTAAEARTEETLERLVDGYGRRPPGLRWHLAVATLRRAVFPFRTRPTADWPGRVEAMVTTAERQLSR